MPFREFVRDPDFFLIIIKMPRFSYLPILLLSLSFTLAGCNNKVPVRGTVVFSDDGSPLTIGTVILQNEGYSAKGEINSTGSFQITSIKPNDGVPPGVYQVGIAGAVEVPAMSEFTNTPGGAIEVAEASESTVSSSTPIPLIDTKFMNPKTSGITYDTTEGPELKIVVDRFK